MVLVKYPEGMRRTKLIASLGPATDDESVLRGIIRAGVDVARINLSHGSLDDGMERYDAVRRIAHEEKRSVGILADLPGPKVRVAEFKTDTFFELGDIVEVRCGEDESTKTTIEVDYEGMFTNYSAGDRIVIGDGRLVLEVREVGSDVLKSEVVHAGKLSGKPGVHIPADKLVLSTPTDYDLKLADSFVDVGVDMLATVSYTHLTLPTTPYV